MELVFGTTMGSCPYNKVVVIPDKEKRVEGAQDVQQHGKVEKDGIKGWGIGCSTSSPRYTEFELVSRILRGDAGSTSLKRFCWP